MGAAVGVKESASLYVMMIFALLFGWCPISPFFFLGSGVGNSPSFTVSIGIVPPLSKTIVELPLNLPAALESGVAVSPALFHLPKA